MAVGKGVGRLRGPDARGPRPVGMRLGRAGGRSCDCGCRGLGHSRTRGVGPCRLCLGLASCAATERWRGKGHTSLLNEVLGGAACCRTLQEHPKVRVGSICGGAVIRAESLWCRLLCTDPEPRSPMAGPVRRQLRHLVVHPVSSTRPPYTLWAASLCLSERSNATRGFLSHLARSSRLNLLAR